MSKKQSKTYPADYKGATPRQAAEAVLRYRPAKEQSKSPKKERRTK